MGDLIPDLKRDLRQRVRAELAAMGAAQREAASAQARSLIETQTCWRAARSVLFYAPMPQELDVWPLLLSGLAAGKVAALPAYCATSGNYQACIIRDVETDVRPGAFGIREPVARGLAERLNKLDLILVPGVAFDLHGRRLGRGKAFYDQLLATVSGKTVGVAFDQQVVREVPVEPHDVQLNCIVTPTRWLEF